MVNFDYLIKFYLPGAGGAVSIEISIITWKVTGASRGRKIEIEGQ